MQNKIRKKRVVHLVPADTIGGVETAAKTTIGIKNNRFTFFLKKLSKQKSTKTFFSKIKSFVEIFFSTYEIYNFKPDFLIVSLWKSCISAMIIKIFRPSTKIILFLHLPKSVHFADFILNFITAKNAYQVWGDSSITLKERCKELKIDNKLKKRTISFLAYKLRPNTNEKYSHNFIFWGRLSQEKRVDLSIELFARISNEIKGSKFTIIGPDFGELSRLKKKRDQLNLKNKINFIPPLDMNSIKDLAKDCLFFLQLSREEGLGMSVLESMQLGLIPIVTNVGEIKNYCIHNENAVIYKDIESTKIFIVELIKNKLKIQKLKEKAIKKWSNEITYRDDFINAIESLCIENV